MFKDCNECKLMLKTTSDNQSALIEVNFLKHKLDLFCLFEFCRKLIAEDWSQTHAENVLL